MELLVIILNYRTPDLTIQCLRSLAPEIPTIPGTRAVVVDNCSGDGSFERISEAIRAHGWDGWATAKLSERNGGFAYGNNRGWDDGREARYVLLLNSDTVVHSGCLAYCRKVMEAEPAVGVMSCLVLNADGSVQNVTRRVPSPLNQLVCALGLPWKLPALFGWANTEDLGWDRRATKRDVGWVGGAFMFIRGEMLRKIGLLDEDFFFYGEDIEFCHRVRRSGWRVHYDPGATITHLGGASSDPTRMPQAKRNSQRWAARYLVQRKCHGAWAALAVRTIDMMGYGLRLGVMRALQMQGKQRYAELRGAFDSLRSASALNPARPGGTE